MGWVSTSEDIEELRQEHEHFQASTDRLIVGIRQRKSLRELQDAEGSLVQLAERLVSVFESKKQHAKQLLEQAIELLQDPNARVADKLKKRTQQRDDLRAERETLLERVARADESRDKALAKARILEEEVKALKSRLTVAEDQAALLGEYRDVRPLKR